jgi:hypothetical protein
VITDHRSAPVHRLSSWLRLVVLYMEENVTTTWFRFITEVAHPS